MDILALLHEEHTKSKNKPCEIKEVLDRLSSTEKSKRLVARAREREECFMALLNKRVEQTPSLKNTSYKNAPGVISQLGTFSTATPQQTPLYTESDNPRILAWEAMQLDETLLYSEGYKMKEGQVELTAWCTNEKGDIIDFTEIGFPYERLYRGVTFKRDFIKNTFNKDKDFRPLLHDSALIHETYLKSVLA